MSTESQRQVATDGGLTVSWLLAAPVRSFVSKTSGQTCTVVELRDPARLGNSLVLFLDGESGPLAQVSPNTLLTLRVTEVRSGSGRGELIGTATRESVEAAFALAGGES